MRGMQIAVIVLTLGLVGTFTFLLIKKTITPSDFIALSAVWLFIAFIFFVRDKFDLVFALMAFVISLVTFALQQTPLIVLNNLSVTEDGNKLYLYFQNKGSIPTYNLDGCYVFTSHSEPETGRTQNEKVLAFKSLKVVGEAFYPSSDDSDVYFISQKLGLKENLKDQENVYFSIKISYPRIQLWKFGIPEFLGGRKGYEGVFVFNKTENRWHRSSKTHLPEFFETIFRALNHGVSPQFGGAA